MNQLAHTCLHIFKLIVCEILNISRYIEKVLTEVLLRSMQTAWGLSSDIFYTCTGF